MNYNASFIRKIVYIAVIVVLLFPLFYLSQPAGGEASKSRGGILEQQRTKYNLSQSSLGEIDPTSETMKLATMGMRGVAVVVLWHHSQECQKKANFDELAATLRQISKLQPHFLNVWVFQAWNMSYNVSVEFDDYKGRYHWVKKGLDYLMEGIQYNHRKPKLYWHLGWSFGQKFGKSDEQKQFRELFNKDEDYHNTLPIDIDSPAVKIRDHDGQIDNWLVGKEFLLRGQRLADRFDIEELGQSKVIFHSQPAMFQMSYAEAIETEGFFGDKAGEAWRTAENEWTAFGERTLPYTQDDIRFRLNDLDRKNPQTGELDKSAILYQVEELKTDFQNRYPGIRDEIFDEKYAELSDEEREAYELAEESRDQQQQHRAAQAERKVEVAHSEIAERVPEAEREEARRLAAQLADLERRERIINSYRGIVNYEYWRTRCESEQLPEMLTARKSVYDALILHETDADLNAAKAAYDKGFEHWAIILNRFPSLIDDSPETEDLMEYIDEYRELIGLMDEEFPQDFPLQMVIDYYDGQRGRSTSKPKTETTAADDTMTDGGEDVDTDDPRAVKPTPPVPPSETPDEDSGGNDADSDNPRDAAPRPPVPAATN